MKEEDLLMTQPVTRRTFVVTLAGAAAAAPIASVMVTGEASAMGASHEIQMLNKDPDDRKASMVYIPQILQVNAGDTVKFVSADKGHNTKSIDDMIPEGAEAWDSKLNEDFEMTFEVPGFYGYLCTPHSSTGMVGLVVVEGEGKLDNLETAQGVKHRGKARKVWEGIWEEAAEMGLLEATPAA
jgi:pseudoazurin